MIIIILPDNVVALPDQENYISTDLEYNSQQSFYRWLQEGSEWPVFETVR